MKNFCKNTFFFCITIFFVVSTNNAIATISPSPFISSVDRESTAAASTTPKEHPSWLVSLACNHVLTVIAFELFILLASTQAQKVILEQLTPQNITTTAAHEYLTHLITTIIHEGGHAATAAALTGASPTINLGSASNTKPLISLGKVNITGINPATGLTTFKIPQNTSAEKKAAIFLAGGISGIIGHYLIKILYALEQKEGSPKAIDRIASASGPDTILFEQLAMMLLPYESETGCKSDGAKVMETCIGMPKTITKKVTPFAPLLEIFAQFYLVDCEKQNKAVTPIDEFLVALINYQLRGYFRFHL